VPGERPSQARQGLLLFIPAVLAELAERHAEREPDADPDANADTDLINGDADGGPDPNSNGDADSHV
jgi:hypothetical protein